LKQAINRYMIEMGFTEDEAYHFTGTIENGKSGHLDTLTVIPSDEVVAKGIPYVRSKMTGLEQSKPELWANFWTKYFVPIWCNGRYKIDYWNISKVLLDSKNEMINRTDNANERGNRTMRSKFSSAHPTMCQFAEEIRTIACDTVRDLKAIETGDYVGPRHKPPYVPKIPLDYESFGAPIVEVEAAILPVVAKKGKRKPKVVASAAVVAALERLVAVVQVVGSGAVEVVGEVVAAVGGGVGKVEGEAVVGAAVAGLRTRNQASRR
jgi:hypothetical protein